MMLCSCCSVTQSCPTLCDPHGLQHARLPCLSPSLKACSSSCPLIQWCHPTISSFVIPFSSCLRSFPASESFPMSWLFSSGGQSIGASASASVLLMNIQGWFPLRLAGWISLQSKGLSGVFSRPQFKSINSWSLSFLYSPTLMSIHDCWKNRIFDYMDFCWQVRSLVFNTLSMFVRAFLPRSKHLLSMMEIRMEIMAKPISWDGSFLS